MKSLTKSHKLMRLDSQDSTYYTQDSDQRRSGKKLHRSRGRSVEYLREEPEEEGIFRIKKGSKEVRQIIKLTFKKQPFFLIIIIMI